MPLCSNLCSSATIRCMKMREFQGLVVGTWTFQNGRSYSIGLADEGHLTFQERHHDGREVRGMLLPEDRWLIGRLIYRDTGDLYGTIMLQLADGVDTLVSYFQPTGASGWAHAVAVRSGKPLKSLMQNHQFSRPNELEVGEVGWSPVLQDCLLHSWKARVAYLEETISSSESTAPADTRSQSPDGTGLGQGVELYEATERQRQSSARLVRRIWSSVDDQSPTPKRGPRRILRKDQGVQCQEPLDQEPSIKREPSATREPSIKREAFVTREPSLQEPSPQNAEKATHATEESEVPEVVDVIEEARLPCNCASKSRRNLHLQTILERQNRRCQALAEDVASLADELSKIQSQPLSATGLWVSDQMRPVKICQLNHR